MQLVGSEELKNWIFRMFYPLGMGKGLFSVPRIPAGPIESLKDLRCLVFLLKSEQETSSCSSQLQAMEFVVLSK